MDLKKEVKTVLNHPVHVLSSAGSALKYKEFESAKLLRDCEKFCAAGEVVEVLPSTIGRAIVKGGTRKQAKHPEFGR